VGAEGELSYCGRRPGMRRRLLQVVRSKPTVMWAAELPNSDAHTCRRRSGRIQCDTGKLLDERESRPPSGGGLTHFEVKTVPESRPPSEPFSIVLLKRTSAAVAMASFI
jgi:hypothetical protein